MKHYWNLRHWWWDRQEHKLTNNILRMLDRSKIIYLHRNESSKPIAAIVFIDAVDEGYMDRNFNTHDHLEGS